MNDFLIWFTTGVEHILDINAYDHILFVVLLVMATDLKQWKSLLILISGFTIGHSLSLFYSTVTKITIPQLPIEILIATTILLSALYNLIILKNKKKTGIIPVLVIVIVFGLIHGLGFSFLLKAMLGKEQSVILPLLYFNLGIEAAQLIIVIAVLVFSLLLTELFKFNTHTYKFVFVCIIFIIALKITVERSLPLF